MSSPKCSAALLWQDAIRALLESHKHIGARLSDHLALATEGCYQELADSLIAAIVCEQNANMRRTHTMSFLRLHDLEMTERSMLLQAPDIKKELARCLAESVSSGESDEKQYRIVDTYLDISKSLRRLEQ